MVLSDSETLLRNKRESEDGGAVFSLCFTGTVRKRQRSYAFSAAAVVAISEILKAETGVFRPPEMCGNGLRRRKTGRERERPRETENNMEG